MFALGNRRSGDIGDVKYQQYVCGSTAIRSVVLLKSRVKTSRNIFLGKLYPGGVGATACLGAKPPLTPVDLSLIEQPSV